MIRTPPRSTQTATVCPYAALVRSVRAPPVVPEDRSAEGISIGKKEKHLDCPQDRGDRAAVDVVEKMGREHHCDVLLRPTPADLLEFGGDRQSTRLNSSH